MTTFGEQRTASQVLIDAIVLHRVKRGIALLEEKHGPGWVDKIDMDNLRLSDGEYCVLGQVYNDAEVSEEESEQYANSPVGLGHYVDDDDEGYTKGLAILDGPLIEEEYGPAKYGFLDPGYFGGKLQAATDEELAEDWGVTREMVDAAVAEVSDPDYLTYGYTKLQDTWETELLGKAGE